MVYRFYCMALIHSQTRRHMITSIILTRMSLGVSSGVPPPCSLHKWFNISEKIQITPSTTYICVSYKTHSVTLTGKSYSGLHRLDLLSPFINHNSIPYDKTHSITLMLKSSLACLGMPVAALIIKGFFSQIYPSEL